MAYESTYIQGTQRREIIRWSQVRETQSCENFLGILAELQITQFHNKRLGKHDKKNMLE